MIDVLTKARDRLHAIRREIEVLVEERDRIATFMRVYEQFSGDAAPEKAQPLAPSEEVVAPSSSAPFLVPSRAERIRELHAQHPNLTAVEAADRLGIRVDHLRSVSKGIGVTWAASLRGRPSHRTNGTTGSGGAPASAPEPQPAPAAEREPAPFANINTQVVRRPKGPQFYLRNDAGEYLHCSCESMTGDRNYAWRGNEQHLVAVRRRFPLAQDLREQVIEKEQARVVA